MDDRQNTASVRQLRLVVEAPDYEAAVHFYRDVLGLPEELAVSGPDGAQVTILSAGRATLELANPAQKRFIDEVEVGRQVAPRLRIAFEVGDTQAVLETLVDAGATLIAPPVITPWRSLNARLEGPAGLQLTLFEELDDNAPARQVRPARASDRLRGIARGAYGVDPGAELRSVRGEIDAGDG